MPKDTTHVWCGQYYKKGRFDKWMVFRDEWMVANIDPLFVSLKKIAQL